MIEEALIGGVLGLVGFVLGRFGGRKRPTAKYPCPWVPCGYPLSETPLVSQPETEKYYAVYAPETCEGCSNTVIWSRVAGTYQRFTPPANGGKS